jgi:hypothetical protein
VNQRALHRIGLGSVVTLLLALPVTSHAQAAVESALTNALSSSTTVKVGSAPNHALNQSSTQLGIRIQERTSSSVRVGAQQQLRGAPQTTMKGATSAIASHPAVRAGSSPALGGISVHGAETACPSGSPPIPASPANPAATNADAAKPSPGTALPSVDCHGNNSVPDSGTDDKYKSFVTLPLPK